MLINKNYSNPRLFSILYVRKGFRELPFWAKLMHAYFLFNLICGILTLLIASVPDMIRNSSCRVALFTADVFICSIFGLEFILSVYSAPKYQALLSFMTFVDFMSFFPFVVLLVTTFNRDVRPYTYASIATTVVYTVNLSTYRFIRIFRVLRAFRYVDMVPRLRMMAKALKNSSDGVLVISVMLPFLILLFSMMIFYAEQTSMYFQDGAWYYDEDATLSPYQSITSGFWITILMFTSLGLPSNPPRTLLAKLILSISMVSSIFLVAFPVTVVTIQLQQTVRYFKLKQRRKKYLKSAADRIVHPQEKGRKEGGKDELERCTNEDTLVDISPCMDMQDVSRQECLYMSSADAISALESKEKTASQESILACPLTDGNLDSDLVSNESTPPILLQQMDQTDWVSPASHESDEFPLPAKSQTLVVSRRRGVIGGKKCTRQGIDAFELEKEMELSLNGRWPEKVVLRLRRTTHSNGVYLDHKHTQAPSRTTVYRSDSHDTIHISFASPQVVVSLEMDQEERLRRLVENLTMF